MSEKEKIILTPTSERRIYLISYVSYNKTDSNIMKILIVLLVKNKYLNSNIIKYIRYFLGVFLPEYKKLED